MDVKRPTPRHIIIKRPKVKDKERETLKSIKRKAVSYQTVARLDEGGEEWEKR